jgi:glycosyltransferase involved in cell wall biosynthesis
MSQEHKNKHLVIMHFISSLKLGGAESALVNYLTHAQRDQGYEHHVSYIHDGPNRIKIEQLGMPVYNIRGMVHTYDPVIMWRLYRLVQKIKPDIIHTSLWSANVIGRSVGKICRIPIISDLHGLPRHEGRLRNWLEAQTMGWSDRIVAVADVVKADYEKIIIGARRIDQHKLLVIKNGIDYTLIRNKAHHSAMTRADSGFAAADDDFVIGAVGRLEPIKSYDVLIKAFAKAVHDGVPKMKLCLVGDGSQMQELRTLTHMLGVAQYVVFLGYKSDAYNLYPLFDCFALSSQSEGLSIALLEAMSFGLPVITTHDGLTHDVVVHGVNGLLVKPNDVNGYSHAIMTVHDDHKMRVAMAYSNRSLIESHFSLDSVVKQYHALYQSVYR